MKRFKHIIVTQEINDGQLVRFDFVSDFLIHAQPINKVKGRPFGVKRTKTSNSRLSGEAVCFKCLIQIINVSRNTYRQFCKRTHESRF